MATNNAAVANLAAALKAPAPATRAPTIHKPAGQRPAAPVTPIKPAPAASTQPAPSTQPMAAAAASQPSQSASLPNAITRETVIADARRLGNAEGAGMNSRHELAMIVAEACSAGVDAMKPGDDIKATWAAFQQAQRGVALSPGYEKEKSFQVQVSKLNAVAKFGAHPKVDAVAVLDNVKHICVDMRAKDETKVSIFDAMVKVSRRHADRADAMTSDEIRAELLPTEAGDAEATEVKALERTIAGMRKMEKQFPSDPLTAAIEKLEKRLAALVPNKEATIMTLVGMGYTRKQAEAMAAK